MMIVIIVFPLTFFGQHILPGDSLRVVIPDSILWAPYRIMLGHRVAHSKWGEINIRPYTYFRYLNQTAIDKTYTDGFGKPQTVDPRQDIQLQKVSIYFSGWAFNPKFNYFLYVWTTNASQGQGAQVVDGGETIRTTF
jgi:hypothetical protein